MLWVVGPPCPLVGREERVLQYSISVEPHTMVGVATHLLQSLGVSRPTLHHHIVSTGGIETLKLKKR